MPSRPSPMGPPDWETTGRARMRSGWFGVAILEEEVTRVRNTWEPRQAYSPGTWVTDTRWRRARHGKTFSLVDTLALTEMVERVQGICSRMEITMSGRNP